MFRIVVTALFFLGGEPQDGPVRLHSQEVFETQEQCEELRPAPGTIIIVEGTPALVEQSACARLPDDPDGIDLIADTLRRMIRGGGFGTINN